MRIVVFGTGECMRRVCASMKTGVDVVALSDNDPQTWNRRVHGMPVIPPADIASVETDYVLVCSSWAREIVGSLVQSGIHRDRVLSYYEVSPPDPRRTAELALLDTLIDRSAAALPVAPRPAAKPDLRSLDRYRRYESCVAELDAHALEGYFLKRHAAVFDILLAAQGSAGIAGNLLEIGVFHGRSAVIAILHQAPGETVTLADVMDSDSVRALLSRYPDRGVEYLVGDARQTLSSEVLMRRARSYRWIHIDGNHTYPFVYGDLERADALLKEDGLVTMDDAFSPFFPEVTQALFHYMDRNPGRFALLALGDQKAYLARPGWQETYFHALRPLFAREVAKRGWKLHVKNTGTVSLDSKPCILFRPAPLYDTKSNK